MPLFEKPHCPKCGHSVRLSKSCGNLLRILVDIPIALFLTAPFKLWWRCTHCSHQFKEH